MTVLVTGGAGYIGSHACKSLYRNGLRPVVFDNLSTGHRKAVKWGPLVVGDLADVKTLDRAFTEHKPVAVLHFAAKALVVESMRDPSLYYSNNTVGTLNLLDAMRRHGVQNIVFSSTCAVYGNPIRLPLDEEHPLQPISPYGRSKRMVEEILRDYESAYGLRSVCLRYFNAAGADLEGELGEDHTPETHLIPSLLLAALGKREPLVIYGDDFATRDGTAIRDYIHVSDLADAHVAALRYLQRGGKGTAINLGTGRGSSIREVLASAQRIGCPIPHRFDARRLGEPAELTAQAARAHELLGWIPQHTLDTSLETAWRWFSRSF